MASPVPKYLRTGDEIEQIPRRLRDHVVDLKVDPADGAHLTSNKHPAKYAPGLATALLSLAGEDSIGDPMAGSGRFFEETRIRTGAANDLDPKLIPRLRELVRTVSNVSADKIRWRRNVCIFSPPYYPRTDRRRPNAHDDANRGPVVGFRDSYGCSDEAFIGNPGGVGAILAYREAMTGVYRHMTRVCRRMIVVTKNWTRLGVELRLDLDTILMATDAGWTCVGRSGWVPPASLWSRFNNSRGTGSQIEDVLVFDS